MVRTVAEQHGLWATFMPKPFSHLTGNGAHVHLSLADEKGKNLFLDSSAELGLAQIGRWFMGGVLRHAGGLSALVAPTVNSYKRLVRGAPRSGATWAPVYITYGASNRTQMIRIPAPGRFEIRVVDGAANPYLAFAGLIAAGLDGIAQRIDPGQLNLDNLYELPEEQVSARKIEVLPETLDEAIKAMTKDSVVKGALGKDYAELYLKVKREEWMAHNRTVSSTEREHYLAIY
jgi:glutamine synthetase